MHLTPGTTVDRYELRDVLGRGGFATVWRACHTVLGSEHALKILEPRWVADDELRARFLDEGRIQARLEHPHIVRVTDIVVADGVAGLVMTLVRGPALDTLLDRRTRPFDPDEARDLLLPVLDACGFAHEQGVIHRDLKPANVLVATRRGQPVPMILDFGIARLLDHAAVQARRHTRAGARMGSLDAMAPEQIASADQVDHRADIYALGVVLAELLTLQRPFGDGSELETLRRVADGRPVDAVVASLRRSPLGQVALRAFSHDPAARFGSCDEMADAVRAALGAHSPRPAPSPPPPAPAPAPSPADETTAPRVVLEAVPAAPPAPSLPRALLGAGRTRRGTWWLAHALLTPAILAWMALLDAPTAQPFDPSTLDARMVFWGALLGGVPLTARRLHDAALPAWPAWALGGLTLLGTDIGPAIVYVCLLVFAFLPPTRGPNRYGPDPRA